MEIGDNMGELNRYSQLVRNSRLKKLAGIIIEQNLNPAEVLNEFAGFSALQNLGQKWFGDKESEWRGNVANQAASSNQSYLKQWDAAHKAATAPPEEKKPEPMSVDQLADQLKQHLQHFGYSDDEIDKMVKDAIERRHPKPFNVGMGVGAKQDAPAPAKDQKDTKDDKNDIFGGSSFVTGANVDPKIAAQYGVGKSFTTNDPFDPNQSDSDRNVERPDWYKDMTQAERIWFDNLTTLQKRNFVNMYDQMTAGGYKAGHAPIPSEDMNKVQTMAFHIKQRNPHKSDQEAFLTAAGLWTRHKIRDRVKDMMGDDDPNNPIPHHDDLLQKDHHKKSGPVLNEWCFLAGIKPEKTGRRAR
jgi:hypothetical protein